GQNWEVLQVVGAGIGVARERVVVGHTVAAQVDSETGVGNDAVPKNGIPRGVWKPETGCADKDADIVECDAIARARGQAAHNVVMGAVRKRDAVARVAQRRNAIGLRANEITLDDIARRIANAVGGRYINAVKRRVARDDVAVRRTGASDGVVRRGDEDSR